jgi:hypothetical protein
MPVPDPDLLDLWERGLAETPAARALLVLAALEGPAAAERAAALPVGHRDAALLEVHARLFGPRLDAVAECAGCGAWLDLTTTTDDLRLPEPPAGEELELREGAYDVRFRLPTAADLARAAAEVDPEQAPGELLRACVLRAARGGSPVSVAALPPALLDAVEARMAAADPGAELALVADCPECGTRSTTVLDPGAFVWARVEAEARRAVREVHVLASAYGWSEPETLRLSPARRQLYLALVGS